MLRLTGGILFLALYLGLVWRRKPMRVAFPRGRFITVLTATFLGTYLGILLQPAFQLLVHRLSMGASSCLEQPKDAPV